MNLSATPSEWTPSALFGNLPVLKIGFSVRIPRRSRLPQYLGSTWRGLIGWELQRLICPFNHHPECKTCIIQDHCPYYVLFEKETRHSGVPRGYILYPPMYAHEGQEELEITLIGQCTRFLPVVMTSVIEGRSSGLGAECSPYDITGLWEKLPDGRRQPLSPDVDAISDVAGPFPLSDWLDACCRDVFGANGFQAFFLTPLRLRKQGRYITKMDWPFFFTTIACRLEALNCLFHAGEPLGREIFLKLQTCFEPASRFSADLKWVDYTRFSNRQRRKVMMGGLVGATHPLKSMPDELRSWWQAASLLHAGKGASMGLGRVTLLEK